VNGLWTDALTNCADLDGDVDIVGNEVREDVRLPEDGGRQLLDPVELQSANDG
jgi:hypothetical protein